MNNIMGFAREAIETAGEHGKEKRKYQTEVADRLARSRMAELERGELGRTRRQEMMEAGLESKHKREYGIPSRQMPSGGFRRTKLADIERQHEREYGPGSIRDIESKRRFGTGGIEERRLAETGKRTDILKAQEKRLAEVGLRQPIKPKYKENQVWNLVKDINKEERPPTENEMILFGEMTKGLPIEVKEGIIKKAEKKYGLSGLFGKNWFSDNLAEDKPEYTGLVMKRREPIPTERGGATGTWAGEANVSRLKGESATDYLRRIEDM